MPERYGINLLNSGKSSFWNTKKKILVILVVGVAVAGAAGFFISQRTAGKAVQVKGATALNDPVLPPEWLQQYFGTTDVNAAAVGSAYGDADQDGLNNYQEYLHGTNPANPDTDGDGKKDGEEIAYGTNPLVDDTLSAEAGYGSGVEVQNQQAKQALRELAGAGSVDTAKFEELLNYKGPPAFPQIPDSELHIVPSSEAATKNYEAGMKGVLKFFEDGKLQEIYGGLTGVSDVANIAPYKKLMDMIILVLKDLPVPENQAANHKQFIVLFGALQEVVTAKEMSLNNTNNSPEAVLKILDAANIFDQAATNIQTFRPDLITD